MRREHHALRPTLEPCEERRLLSGATIPLGNAVGGSFNLGPKFTAYSATAAEASPSSGSITVLLGNGNGSFTGASSGVAPVLGKGLATAAASAQGGPPTAGVTVTIAGLTMARPTSAAASPTPGPAIRSTSSTLAITGNLTNAGSF